MMTRAGLVIGVALALAGVAFAARAEVALIERSSVPPIVFECRNGVSISVWSAASVSFSMRFALALDGFRLGATNV